MKTFNDDAAYSKLKSRSLSVLSQLFELICGIFHYSSDLILPVVLCFSFRIDMMLQPIINKDLIIFIIILAVQFKGKFQSNFHEFILINQR